ncbi:sce7726 family protein [Brucella ciceri]
MTMLAMTKLGTTDTDIRSALHAKRLRRAKSQPDTLVIDELGLAHARSRIDVAVINGCIHGYEIKSAKDNLERFATQMDIYRQTLQKLTLVAAPKHIAGILAHAPEWCGVIAAEEGPRGGINFQVLRNAAANPEIDPVMMAHLLWRDEVIQLLDQAGYAPKDLRRPRKQLYEMLCEAMSLREITASIRAFMAQRQTWRDRPARALCDG